MKLFDDLSKKSKIPIPTANAIAGSRRTIILSIIILFTVFVQRASAQEYISPQSVVYYAEADIYLVSDIGTAGRDDGTIKSVDKNGVVSKFNIEDLTDPKGMVIFEKKLYICDMKEIVVIDMVTRHTLSRINVNFYAFLSDIIFDGVEFLYVTDTQRNNIFRVDIINKEVLDLKVSSKIKAPRGIVFDRSTNRLIVTTFKPQSEIFAVNLSDNSVNLLFHSADYYYDGITLDNKGNYYVASWGSMPLQPKAGIIFRFAPDCVGGPETFMINLESPADIFYCTEKNTLAIPENGANRLKLISMPSKPNYPALIYPMDKFSGMGVSIRFEWQKKSLAETYKIQLSKTEDFEVITNEAITKDSVKEFHDLLLTAQYFWRVKSVSKMGESDWSPTRSFIVSSQTFDIPVPTSPADNKKEIELDPVFAWHTPHPVLFRLQLDTAVSFDTKNLVDVWNLIDTSYQYFRKFKINTKYYWRMKQYSGHISSYWSNIFTFTTVTKPYPAKPVLTNPPNDAKDVSIKPIYLWNDTKDADSYVLHFSKDSAFKIGAVDVQIEWGENYMMETILLNNSTYYWYVTAQANYGGTKNSEVWKFKTIPDPSAISEEIENGINLTGRRIEVTFNSGEWPIAQSIVYDIYGRNILSCELNSANKSIDCATLENGIYFVRVMLGGKVITKKLLLQ